MQGEGSNIAPRGLIREVQLDFFNSLKRYFFVYKLRAYIRENTVHSRLYDYVGMLHVSYILLGLCTDCAKLSTVEGTLVGFVFQIYVPKHAGVDSVGSSM